MKNHMQKMRVAGVSQSVAESKPDEKEMMISVIMNCICG